MITLEDALIRGIGDIWTFNLGMRQMIKDEGSLYRLVLNRFNWAA